MNAPIHNRQLIVQGFNLLDINLPSLVDSRVEFVCLFGFYVLGSYKDRPRLVMVHSEGDFIVLSPCETRLPTP